MKRKGRNGSAKLDSFFSGIEKSIDSGIRATYNKATGWLGVTFPSKPSTDTLTGLKLHGFRWKPRAKRWIGKWTAGREDHLKGLAGKIERINIQPNFHRKAVHAQEQHLKHLREANERFDRTWKSMKTIPIGQPILVGHHSERSHRSHLRRIDKGFEIARREQAVSEKYKSRAQRYASKARGESPVLLHNRIEKLEAEERSWKRRIADDDTSPKEKTRSKRHLAFVRERLKIERKKYKKSGGIATEKGSFKPGDRVTTRWGKATIKTISKKSARVAFDNLKTSMYGTSTDSKIDVTSITSKLPADKKYVLVKIKKESGLKPYVGKQVTITGEQHRHQGCEIYGTARFAKRGKIVKGKGKKLYFVEKDSKTRQPISVGKLTMTRRDKVESDLYVKEVRPTW